MEKKNATDVQELDNNLLTILCGKSLEIFGVVVTKNLVNGGPRKVLSFDPKHVLELGGKIKQSVEFGFMYSHCH